MPLQVVDCAAIADLAADVPKLRTPKAWYAAMITTAGSPFITSVSYSFSDHVGGKPPCA